MKQKGLSCQQVDKSRRESLPIPEVWQQLDAGYHDESWKSNAIECAKYDQEAKNET